LRDSAFDPLNSALERHLIVRFPYLKPGDDEAREREVVPLALVQYQGRWHLSAEETDFGSQKAGEHKMFLLRRIVGSVVSGKAAAPPEGDQAALALASLEEIWERGTAEVEVTCETDAATRLANRRGTEEVSVSADGSTRLLRLHYVDAAILADELAGFGPEVLVLSPIELRDAVVERLQRVERDHG
jgi:proteasome accessory factor B